MTVALTDHFMPALGCLLEPTLDQLATQLELVPALDPNECDLIHTATRTSLLAVLHAKLARLLLVELHAARVGGGLRSVDSTQRWHEFVEQASQHLFWEELAEHYPTLLPRVQCIIRQRCRASVLFAERLAADREHIADLCGGRVGLLQELNFGAGDSHRGGLTVTLLRFESGRVVYKPRSMAVDFVLNEFIAELAQVHGALQVRIPRSKPLGDYGWSEFIEHRHTKDDAELASFYQGMGHWLAILHLLGASDMHAENLIAHGGIPVVVDCETLFMPRPSLPPSGFGQAFDHAAALISCTVLYTGLLPGRLRGLRGHGLDYSGMGLLPGQQPLLRQPAILLAGTDQARVGSQLVVAPVAQNHPSSEPALVRYWPHVLEAFDQLTGTLRRLDQAGELENLLHAFANCRIRVVPKSTETYAEIAHMLWHPVSLHNEAKARQRAQDLFTKMAAQSPLATNAKIIESEIEDLLLADIPYFSTIAREGLLTNSHGDTWRVEGDLVQASLQRWRKSDLALERNVIRASMVSAYLNDGHLVSQDLLPGVVRHGNLDARRRMQAARIMHELIRQAIRAEDGSVSWIAPVYSPVGWSVQPLAADLYNGLSGIALLSAAYAQEMHAGRADPVSGIKELYAALSYTLRLAEAKFFDALKADTKGRPPAPGAYIGLGAQIWALLMLAHCGGCDDELRRAVRLAEGMLDAAATDETCDMLTGRAGAIPVLLALAAQTGNAQYLAVATQVGDQLREQAQWENDKAYWAHARLWPRGLGGFSHGVTGIGWALARLAQATGQSRFTELAQAAFHFEDAIYDEAEQNWLDLRHPGGSKTAAMWCHGAVGIGLAHLDLDPRLEHPRTAQLLQRAVRATARSGLGWNHCLCHGDFGAWELLDLAIACGIGPDGMTREGLQAYLLTSLEDYGTACGLTRDMFVPGLLAGVSGVAYQLLRMHPDNRLPSVLLAGTGL